ncbi:restriction endonuclease [Mucilaginibacter sp.]|uniref:restriction endonuclease n=1 Tax=Mucilaginibacter sp. TaxID=1882438 RepID=UPI0035BC7F8B
MKAGAEYEQFIYQKFKDFYVDMDVKVNDKILGKQSGIKREIDVSVSGEFEGVPLLYLVQCKDHNKPADVKILGEFSAVIKDVGASKGFLICSSGFAKTIHQYAKTLGIELLTVEDINSPKWTVDIEIPFVYEKHEITAAHMTGSILPSEELVSKNHSDIKVTINDFKFVSFDNGCTVLKLTNYINMLFPEYKMDIFNGKPLILDNPELKIYFSKVWTQANFHIEFSIQKTNFLKYLKPNEFTQVVNHVSGEILPIKFTFNEAIIGLNDEYVEVDANDMPVFTNLNFAIQEHPSGIGELALSNIKMG